MYVLFKAQTRSNLTSFVDFKNLNRVRLILNFQIRLKYTHDKNIIYYVKYTVHIFFIHTTFLLSGNHGTPIFVQT